MPTVAEPNTVNIHQAKTHLSRLVEQAARGQEFIIAKAGRPMVRVVPITPVGSRRDLGGLAGAYALPQDIKAGFADDIAAMFNLETAVGRARVGCNSVRWQGATTLRAFCPQGGATPPACRSAAQSGV